MQTDYAFDANGVIDVAILSIIQRWHFCDHVSLREIAKRLGVSRNTVRCYIRAGTVLPTYPEPERVGPMGPKSAALDSRRSNKYHAVDALFLRDVYR